VWVLDRKPAIVSGVVTCGSRLVIPAAVFIALSILPSYSQEIVSAEKFFDGLSATYGAVADYTATVTMTTGKNAPWQGRLSYKSPVFLRIDFDTPKGQVLVMDGEKLTLYIPGLEVVEVQRYRKSVPSNLGGLASKQGLNLLRANYGVAFLSSPQSVPLEEGSKELVVKLKLTPKSSGAPFSEIILSVGKDNLIRRMDALYASGERMVMDLVNVRINQNIPDSRFQYDSPPYANVVEDFLFSSSE
jgi:outer membrane lipoprotein-sorting protein